MWEKILMNKENIYYSKISFGSTWVTYEGL